MKKEIVIVTALVLVATGILFALNLTSGKPNTNKNGFNRVISNATLKEVNRIKLSGTLFHIVGFKDDSIYFTGKKPGCVYMVTDHLKKIDTLDLHIPENPKLYNHFPTFVNYPDVYIIGGNARTYISGNLESGFYKVDTLISKGAPLNVVKIGDAAFIFRRITEISTNADFAKINIKSKDLQSEKNISPALSDAGFTHDGILDYDVYTNTLVHVPYYNNNITTFDTSLNLIARFHTIDTNSTARNHTIHVGSSVTLKNPPAPVNSRSWVFNGHLYVLSKLQADNESSEAFSVYRPIDQYEISSGKYLRSYKLPILNGQNIIDIKMRDAKTLICLFTKTIILFEIRNI